jgi:hypothetical protein
MPALNYHQFVDALSKLKAKPDAPVRIECKVFEEEEVQSVELRDGTVYTGGEDE